MERSRISSEELEELARNDLPVVGKMGLKVDEIEPGRITVRLPFREDFVRPGGTLAGPVVVTLADFVMYGMVLSLIGRVELAVTTSLNVNFLRLPGPVDLVARGTILKLGKRLAAGEVSVYSGDEEKMVAHVTCTYSIPPNHD